MKKKLVLVMSMLLFAFVLQAQQQPKKYARPLKIPGELAGSFGELRDAHFHAGLDFKTQQREGLPIYAVADGKVVRINVSGTGYGHALYILHQDGMMSVYAHMQRFAPEIEAELRKQQYAKESFEVDFQLAKPIAVKQGEEIGLSGNTGSSGGPHLHFELRNSVGNVVYNPSLHGYDYILDKTPPSIHQLAIYPADDASLINGQTKPLFLQVSCKNGHCTLPPGTEIRSSGKLYFGVEVIDRMDNSFNKFGLYTLSLKIDDEEVYQHSLDSFSFSETRQILALIDYKTYVESGKRIQQSKILPNNTLSLYKNVKDGGVYELSEGVHRLSYEVTDASGNLSKLAFDVKSEDADVLCVVEDCNTFAWQRKNHFEDEEIVVDMNPNALFDDICFEYRKEDCDSLWFSNIHYVHHATTPLLKKYQLKIAPKNLAEELYSKAVILNIDTAGVVVSSEGGSEQDGFIVANSRKFGIFVVGIDTVMPEITPLNIVDQFVNLSEQSELRFTIVDDCSGIYQYRGSIDGEWILMEYDPKKKLLRGMLDPNLLTAGEHIFELRVSDKKGNLNIYNAIIKK